MPKNNKIGFFSTLSPSKANLLKVIPKTELHVHIEGTMPFPLLQKMDKKYSANTDPSLYSKDGTRLFCGTFPEFLTSYDAASGVINCPEAMTEAVYEYLKRSHHDGSVYTELTVSPDHLARYKISYAETILAAEKGIKKAHAEFGIESRIIVVLVRHLGSDACLQLVRNIIEFKNEYVCGIGLAGDEINYPPELFVDAFKEAKAAGLKLTAHAGEWTNSEDVIKAIKLLKVDRIGHGIHAAFDPEAIKLIKDQGIHLEVCPMSNHKLQTSKNYPIEYQELEHPLTILHEQGVSYSVSTDDPPYFETDLVKEYEYASRLLNLDLSELLEMTKRGIQNSFAPDDLKQRLLEKVELFAVENESELNQLNVFCP